jgi:hypothetical protein
LRRFLSGLASVNQSEDLFSLGASRGDAAAIFAFRLGLGDAFQDDVSMTGLLPQRTHCYVRRPVDLLAFRRA